MAIQIAKHVIGAKVYTTASEKKVELCKQLGADQVINYQQEKYEKILQDMDVCFDTLDEIEKCLKILKPNGVISIRSTECLMWNKKFEKFMYL